MLYGKIYKLVILVAAMLLLVFSADAAKPTDSVGLFLGNNFPGGPHFNLILHGKKESFNCITEVKVVGEDPNLEDDIEP